MAKSAEATNDGASAVVSADATYLCEGGCGQTLIVPGRCPNCATPMPEGSITAPAIYAGDGVDGLIRLAIEHGSAVESLERLMAMRTQLRAESAQSAFHAAMGAFQADCPVIPKTKAVGGANFSYKYAPLEAIVKTVGPLLRQHGFSYSFDTRFEVNPPAQVVVCIVHHIEGHSERSEFRTPVDAGARMNDMQKSASAQTYAKRYAFCNAFGILTGDEDTDGRTATAETTPLYRNPRTGPNSPGDPVAPVSQDIPRPVARNVVTVPGRAAVGGGSSQRSDEGGTPPSTAPAGESQEAALERLGLAERHREIQNTVVATAMTVVAGEARQRGKQAPEGDELEKLARVRIDSGLGSLNGASLATASGSTLEALLAKLTDLVTVLEREGFVMVHEVAKTA